MTDVMSCGVHLRTNVSIEPGIACVERGGPQDAAVTLRFFRKGPLLDAYLTTTQVKMLIAGLEESIAGKE